MPISRSFLTLCWVGLVLSSPAVGIHGTSVRCRKAHWPGPILRLIWRTASRNGSDSMSPTVPPISTIATSTSLFLSGSAPRRMNSWISLVMCGITCTVLPRNSPRRSFSSTALIDLRPVVKLLVFFIRVVMKRS